MEYKQFSLDTNIILQTILGEVVAQRKKAIRALCADNAIYHINDMVLSETIYVLQNKKYNRDFIRNSIYTILSLVNVKYNNDIIDETFTWYLTHPALSFVDCYSAVLAEKTKKSPLLTFDRKLSAQHPSAKML